MVDMQAQLSQQMLVYIKIPLQLAALQRYKPACNCPRSPQPQ